MTTEIIADKHQIPWYRRPLPFGLFYILCVPVALIVMLTGPNYFRVKGGYSRWGKGLKSVFFILALGWFLINLALAIGDASKETASTSPAASESGDAAPHMRVEAVPLQIATAITVTSDDDQPFTMKRIVANGRAGEEGCDSVLKNNGNDPLPPQMLKRGDAAAFMSICGSSVLTADIYTDRGRSTFKFGTNSN
jgi:hypothetical protein